MEKCCHTSGVDISQDIKNLTAIKYEDMYNPTEIGKLLDKKLSSQKVNILLENLGFQLRDEKGKWKPTESGKKYAFQLPFFYKSNNVYIIDFSIRWNKEIINIINQSLKLIESKDVKPAC